MNVPKNGTNKQKSPEEWNKWTRHQT